MMGSNEQGISGTRLRSRSVRGSTLEQLNFTRQCSPMLKQASGPSLGEGCDVVVEKIHRLLESSLQKAFCRFEERQQEVLDNKLGDLSRMIEDLFEPFRLGAFPDRLEKSPTHRKPPEVALRFAELPRCPFGKSQGSEPVEGSSGSSDRSSPQSTGGKKNWISRRPSCAELLFKQYGARVVCFCGQENLQAAFPEANDMDVP